MINTIETGIDICLFPIIGIGIGIEWYNNKENIVDYNVFI